jgi:hypothetical protein
MWLSVGALGWFGLGQRTPICWSGCGWQLLLRRTSGQVQMALDGVCSGSTSFHLFVMTTERTELGHLNGLYLPRVRVA